MGQNADLEESSDDGNQNGYLPRTMTALQYNDELAYIYNFGLWGHGTNGNMAVFEFHLKTALMTGTPLQLQTSIPTGTCFQSVPTVYGMYFATNGNAVGFIPWGQTFGGSSTPAVNGMLGGNPEVYLVIVQNGNNGLTTLSVPFLPGVASLGTWILNNAYSCSGSSSNWLAWFSVVIAAAGLAFGVGAMVAAVEASSGVLAAAVGLGISAAGFGTAIPHVA